MTKKHVNIIILLSISHTTPGNDVKKNYFLETYSHHWERGKIKPLHRPLDFH